MPNEQTSAVGGNTSAGVGTGVGSTVGGPGEGRSPSLTIVPPQGAEGSTLQARVQEMARFLKANEHKPMVDLALAMELSNMGWAEVERKQICVGAFRVWKEMV